MIENQLGKKIKKIQSDGGGEFINNQLARHFSIHGIQHLVSCPSTPQQNGIAKRKHRHLVELGLSMLFHNNAPLHLWVKAFYTANYSSNLLPSTTLKFDTPFHMLFHQKPYYSFLRVFGSACYPCLRPFTLHKFEPRSLQCVFLGYQAHYKGYRCLYPPTGKVYICHHVIFDETCFPFAAKYKDLVPHNTSPLLTAWQSGTHHVPSTSVPSAPHMLPLISSASNHESPTVSAIPQPEIISPSSFTSQEAGLKSEPTVALSPGSITPSSSSPLTAPDTVLPASIIDNSHSMVTRSKARIHKTNQKYILQVDSTIPSEPKTVKSALQHSGWHHAMDEEMESFDITQTWIFCGVRQDSLR